MNRLLIIGAVFFILIAGVIHHNNVTHDNFIKAQEEMTQHRTEEANRIAAEAARTERLKQQKITRENNDKANAQAIKFYNRQTDHYQHQISEVDKYNQVLISLQGLIDRWRYTSDPSELQSIRRDIDKMDSPACLNDPKHTLSTTLGNESTTGNEEETRGAFKVFLTEFNLCIREVTSPKND